VTSQTNGATVNGHRRAVPDWDGWQPIHLGGIPAVTPEPPTAPTEEPTVAAEPAYDPIAHAEADRLRALGEAEAKAKIVEAEAAARAAEILAVQEAKAKEIANEQAALRTARLRAVEEAKIAEAEAKKKAAQAAAKKAEEDAAAEAQQKADRTAEQQRTERYWKWGARGIYAVGLIIAAPVQFLHFWDRQRPFLIAAPALLEGLALVLAFGAAWAVAHRRDVAPYRVGIMLGALIAAAINMYGSHDPRIGFNAGLIGAIASLGGPIVLMAYEHGIAQKADGIPSWRETRAAKGKAAAEQAAKDAAKAEREQAAAKAAAEREAAKTAAEAEQQRKDADRQKGHKDVWAVAEGMRSARGLPVVSDQLWGDAWYYVTGYKLVGMRAEIDELSRAAQARREAVADDGKSLVDSQMSPREKRDPNAPDGRRFNGGTPPRRTPGDTPAYHPAAKVAAADTARQNVNREDS
jgi:chemotaxis protein histidine kinase CheA